MDAVNQREKLKSGNKTFSVNKQQIVKKWYLIDVKDKVLGRCATKIASILKGKTKINYTPHIDNGDYVAIINASKIKLTGKKWKKKIYYKHSGYPGGLSKMTAEEMIKKFPIRIVEKAIFGMLPHTKLGDQMRKKLFVYPNESHRHESQKPQILEV
ncbi:MAG: 50S ribosomal protein L13 [Phytoplasma sp.]|uniref:50S ribosomal protein L13 n=1 Tax=Phytoplasma sp. TaxID=2155 RepID=UPI002B418012|nr:50S ribosomal protein L13 [Phytoplasma sp.]WRH06967.1 MAG: 50S ribosomal protein L13 [Phytoplasma sp.]